LGELPRPLDGVRRRAQVGTRTEVPALAAEDHDAASAVPAQLVHRIAEGGDELDVEVVVWGPMDLDEPNRAVEDGGNVAVHGRERSGCPAEGCHARARPWPLPEEAITR